MQDEASEQHSIFSMTLLQVSFLNINIFEVDETFTKLLSRQTVEAFRAFRTLRELCWEMMRKGLAKARAQSGCSFSMTIIMIRIILSWRRHEYFRCISLLQLFVLHINVQFERYFCECNQAQVHLRSGEQTETLQNTYRLHSAGSKTKTR